MEYKEILRSAFQSLKSNVLRTSLTMLGIIIGITSVILIYSIGQGAVAFITNELSSFGTDYFQINPGSSQFSSFAGSDALTMEDVDAIKNDTSLTNIKSVAPFAIATTQISLDDADEEVMTYGTTTEIFDILKPDITEGEFITKEQEIGSERIVVLGTDVVEKLFGEDATVVGEIVRINNKAFRITGVVESTSALGGGFINNAAFVPIEIVTQEILGKDSLQEIDVGVHDPNTVNQTIEDVEALLRDRHNLDENDENDFQIASAQDILATVQTITSLLTTMIVGISAISLLVGGVGVMNIMLVSVTERTKEIGLLKAIGKIDVLSEISQASVDMGKIVGQTWTLGTFKATSLSTTPLWQRILFVLALS